MKLNKVMALALSGLMAVSMLAGCSNGTPNGEENGEQPPVVATDAASTMNKVQSTVKFESDPTLASVLAAAVKEAEYNTLKSANMNLNVVATDKVADYMMDNLNGKYGFRKSSMDFAVTSGGAVVGAKADTTVTETVVYLCDDKGFSEEYMAAKLATNLNMGNYPTTIYINNQPYDTSYTGTVSIAAASSSMDGNSEAGYYIAVSITRTIAKDANKNGNAA